MNSQGVESRLATLSLDTDDMEKLAAFQSRPEISGSLPQGYMAEMVTTLPFFFNMLNIRRAIIPAANGHCSARALARYYATLASGGNIPPPHSSLSKPLLGDHPHIPKLPSVKIKKKSRSCNIRTPSLGCSIFSHNDDSISYNLVSNMVEDEAKQHMFSNPNIHDAFMGLGDFSNLVFSEGKFGLGFRIFESTNSHSHNTKTFGHSGIGGSTGFCNVEHNFAIAVTVNKMSLGGVTRKIIQLVCAELKIPLPVDFSDHGQKGPDMQLSLQQS